MRFSRFLLVTLIFAAAVTAAVNIFRDNDIGVTVSEVKIEDYAPYIILSGSIAQDDYLQASTGASVKGEMLVTTVVSESNISEVKEGQRAEITGDGFKNKSYTAYVVSIGKTAKKVAVGNSKVVVVDVVLEIENSDEALKSGFTARIKLFTDNADSVAVVPYSSVLQDGSGEYVYIYKDGKAIKRSIETKRELSNGYEVVSGVGAGDIVITSPLKINSDVATVFVEKRVD